MSGKHATPPPQSPDDGGTDTTPLDGEQPTTALQEWNAEVLDATPGLREVFLELLMAVPDPPDDATARIVGQILEAQSVEELDRPWDAEGMRDLRDTVVRVNSVHKMPSDYRKGLGTYLVCNCTDPASGEQFVLTTGSVSIVAQLVRAHALGGLPLEVVPKMAEKASKNGYFPMHLELVRRGRRVRAAIPQAPAADQAETGKRS